MKKKGNSINKYDLNENEKTVYKSNKTKEQIDFEKAMSLLPGELKGMHLEMVAECKKYFTCLYCGEPIWWSGGYFIHDNYSHHCVIGKNEVATPTPVNTPVDILMSYR